MKIISGKPRKVGSSLQYSLRPRDVDGDDTYLFTATGPGKLLNRMLKDVDVEITIRPKATERDAQAAIAELAAKANQGLAEWARGPLKSAAKRAPKAATAGKSIYLRLQRLEGKGTFWAVRLNGLFIPAGVNLFLIFPPVSSTSGIVFPLSGDTDLFLSLNGPVPVVRSSVHAGLIPDAVSFSLFPFEFLPFFGLNGFRTSVTNFVANGFGFP